MSEREKNENDFKNFGLGNCKDDDIIYQDVKNYMRKKALERRSQSLQNLENFELLC